MKLLGWILLSVGFNSMAFAIEFPAKDIKKQFENHMIIAHSNSLRAIVKILDNKTNEEITSLNILTGVPLVYNFNENFNIESKEFLIDEEKLKLKQKEIANQGKIK